MCIPNNKSFTCFQAHELMFLSFYTTTWWYYNRNNNGSIFLFNFLSIGAEIVLETSFNTKPKWENTLVISLSLASVTPCESSIVVPCSSPIAKV